MCRLWAAATAVLMCMSLAGSPALAADDAKPDSPKPVTDPNPTSSRASGLGWGGFVAMIGLAVRLTVDSDGAVDRALAVVVARRLACVSVPAGDARSACYLDWVRESRHADGLLDSEAAADFLAQRLAGTCGTLTGMQAATCRGLLGGLGACDSLDDPYERDICQGYVIEADCEIPTPVEKTTQACLFGRATAAGSLWACALLKNADARHLCEARVTGRKASCDKLSRSDLVKRCRKALHSGEMPSLEWLAGGDAAPEPQTSGDPHAPAGAQPPKDEEDPCANADPNDPICGMQAP